MSNSEDQSYGIDESNDWITKYLAYSEGAPTPKLFRLWAAIGAIAGTLERRVFVSTAQSLMFPNLFILLVAPPAVGKSIAIDPIAGLWRDTQKIHVAPDSVTKASLIDALVKADRKILVPNASPPQLLEYHSLACCVSELGVLLPSHDLEFLSSINIMYDNRANYREERRTLNRTIDISRPQLNILAGSQPGFMASLLPEEAWSMGTTSRMIMVYAGQTPYVELFDRAAPDVGMYKELVKALTRLTDLIGEARFTTEAKACIREWHKAGGPPIPEHSKLEHYRGRRIINVLKLAMISMASRTGGLVIELCDVQRALGWLLHAEKLMPDIFRHMVGKSDSQTIQELHFFLFREYAKNKKPLHESVIFHFLSQHAPSDKIPKIIEIAERSNIIVRVAGSPFYTPKPKNEHGVE
jgi:hypothetical protein